MKLAERHNSAISERDIGVETHGEPRRISDRWPLWLRCLAALIIECALTAVLVLIEPHLPLGRFPMPYIVAIGLIAYYLGDEPAILAFFVGVIAFDYYFVPPSHVVWPIANTPAGWAAWIAFVLGTAFVGASTVFLRRSEVQAKTALKRAEKELSERMRQAAILTEQAQIVDLGHVLIRDMVGRITLWTTGDEQLYGYTKDEAIGRISNELLQTVFPEPLPDIEAKVFSNGRWEGDLIHTRRDGDRICVASHWVLYHDAEGDPAGILEVNNDITELKRAEEDIRKLNESLEQRVIQRTAELEAANKELESFSYSVSHDLRTPLRAIDGFSSAVLRNYRDILDARGQDYLDRIRAAAQRMGQLIDDILGLSRATRAEVNRERIDLSAMIGEIVAEIRSSQPERKAEFSIEPDVYVEADPHLIQIAVRNLLQNAWKFTSTRKMAKIRFSASDQDGERIYCISDNGVGFEPEYAGKLFTAFQRLHTEAEFPGTGIGLALVQRIIRKHGGRVRAEGAVGKGATFCFTLR